MSNFNISNKDRGILRELAKKQYAYSQLPIMKERAKDWLLHNDLKGKRPMIHVEVGTFQSEIINDKLRCEGDFARGIEYQLLHNMLNHEILDDDMIVPEYYGIHWQSYFRLFDISISRETVKDSKGRSIGHHFNHVISDLEKDFSKLGETKFGVNKEATFEYKEFLENIFGDILPVKLISGSLYSVPTQNIVHLMGMENMFYSMYDYPELFHQLMKRITDDYISYFRYLEKEGCLLPTVANEGLAQGSLCYTNDLPDEKSLNGRRVLTSDVWGFMDSQETVSLSPEMFEEFIFPYYKKVSDNFGLLSYGCCEPVHPHWDRCISKLSNLRKVSISPWCDENLIGERLRGSKVIYHRKPSPNYLGVGYELDEEAFSNHITVTLKAAKGCKLEISQRDVYTLEGNIGKAKRYVQIIRNLIDKHWV
jgi:hypothetical protein